MSEVSESRKAYIDALKFEREGYLRRGLEDRAKQVDAQIREFNKESRKPETRKR